MIKFNFYCTCGNPKVLCEKYDSFYCAICDLWLEKAPSKNSEFYGRPDVPSKLTEEEKKPIWKKNQ